MKSTPESVEPARRPAVGNGTPLLDDSKHAATEVESVSGASGSASRTFAGQEHGSHSDAAIRMSTQLSRLADRVEDRSLDELARYARGLATSNPPLTIVGWIALGFALTRYIRDSTEQPVSPPSGDRP